MANFKVFSDFGTNLLSTASYQTDVDVNNGFQPNTAARSIALNSYLKTVGIVCVQLTPYFLESGLVSPQSSTEDFNLAIMKPLFKVGELSDTSPYTWTLKIKSLNEEFNKVHLGIVDLDVAVLIQIKKDTTGTETFTVTFAGLSWTITKVGAQNSVNEFRLVSKVKVYQDVVDDELVKRYTYLDYEVFYANNYVDRGTTILVEDYPETTTRTITFTTTSVQIAQGDPRYYEILASGMTSYPYVTIE